MPDPPDDATVAWSRCFVRDYTTCSTDRGSKFAVDLCASSQVQRLIDEVLHTTKYPPDSFLLTFQRADGEEVILNDVRLLTLVEAGLETGGMSRNNLTLQDVPRRRQKQQQQRVPADGASDGEEVVAPRTHRPTVSFKPLPLAIEAPPASGSSKLLRGVDGVGTSSSDTNYVGLVNQAMTCYLNSLLQSLFMTPEFRNAMYMWEYDGNMRDAHKSIPFQLQKLFLLMQTSDRPAVETTALTQSFGWDSSEAWQQHDIQELCRVMFDALEVKFKRTQQSDLISRLYEGKMIDYVRCLECGTEKDREDTYLDIPLPIRPFGANVAYDSVESALSGFVNPERLDGNNQYFCDNCNRKCDAHKGLKFKTFPYLLTLHLKRFDFDYQTLHRIKLNDRVSFPQLLNLNSFVDEAQLLSCSDAADGCRSDDTSTTDSGAVLDDEPHHIPVHPADPAMQDDEGIECWPDTGEGTAASARGQTWRQATCGPYQYQLFSVMIHSGSASGGHYYAYIRDFASQLWFCFNDQSVTPITQEDIERSFGGGIIGGMGGGYSSSTNAYMLMYRRIDRFHNALPLTQEQFPVWIQKLMAQMRDGEREERASKERERHMCKTMLYGSSPSSGNNTAAKRSITFHIHKDSTLEEATELAWKELSFDKLLPLERCRLVLYNQLDDVIEESLERHAGSTMETVLGGVRTTYKYDLLLDWREEGEEFETYLPGNTVVQVYTVDTVMTGEVSGPRRLHISLSGSVSELRDRLGPGCGSRLCLVRPRGELHHLTDSLQCSLKSHGLHRNSRLYASVDDPDDERRPVLSSMFHALCDQFQHTVSVQIVVPRTDPATLERFGIPSLSDWLSSGAAAAGPSDRQLSPPSPPCSPPDEPPLAAAATGGWSDVCDSARSSDQSASENSSVTTDSSQRTLIGAVGDSCLPPADESCPGVIDSCDVADGSCVGAAGGVQDVGGSVIVTPSNSPAGSDYQSMLSAQDVVSAAAGDVGLDDAFMSWVNTSQYVQSVIPTMMNEEQTEEERCHFSVQTEICRGSDTLWEVCMDDRMTVSGFKKELECRLNVHRDHLKVFRTYSSNMEHECVRGELLSRGDAAHSVLVKLSRRLEEGELRGKIFLLDVTSDSPITFLFDWILCRGTTVAQAKRVLLAHYKSVKGVDIPPDKCRLRKKSWKNPGKIYLDDFEFGREIPFHVNWELFLQELPDGEPVTDPDQVAVFFRRFYPSEFRVGAVQELVLSELSADTLRARLSELSGLDPALIRLAKPHSVSLSELPSAGAVLLSTLADIDWIHEFKGLDAWPLNIQEDGQVLIYKSSAEPLADAAFQQQRLASMSAPSDAGTPSVPTQPRRERALRIRLDSSH